LSVQLSQRVQNIQPSPTLAITALANQLRAEGRDVIGLGAGEPDFDTPEHIKAAAIDALAAGQTKYTAVDGTASLKQAIMDKFSRDNGLDYEAAQILVSNGGKQSFYNLAQALLQAGDEVLIPAPYWVSYPDMVTLADAQPVILPCPQSQSFKLSAEQLRSAITANTKLLVLNSPSNPTGVAYTLEELQQLAEVLLQHPQVWVATDDMYEHILWAKDGFCNILNACPELKQRTIVLNGVSKAYSMTGWRIGYAAGPQELLQAMKKIQSQSTSNPSSISQAAAEAALNGDQQCVAEMTRHFHQRHDYVLQRLNAMNGVNCLPSDGTFYSFPSVQPFLDSQEQFSTDLELASALLDQHGVAIVPGTAFGAPGHFRLSFATSMNNLQNAMQRLQAFFDN